MARENKTGVRSRFRLGRHRILLKVVEGRGHLELVYGRGFRLGRHSIRLGWLRAVDRGNKTGVRSWFRLGQHRIGLKVVMGEVQAGLA